MCKYQKEKISFRYKLLHTNRMARASRCVVKILSHYRFT
ncbi:hypothetical protein LEP1GSC202_0729 [Leptospira yanagawae serovar Saopaulo str. Sao Paulo = ATCC 700523]|uniref:Uncharacterized protein n=1 Tax=Leptospira yanagawae serovar Saopaulo str. Sao Paulo = ATCC 700523 TaxID=1249483 RepID=A0A5E8HDL7_9LEPT|nr:hypothetical protein LEP1GSC202_0729 [Leptospira yanagawae serovar Saopaulo str. Sao Paulo = ATCC 700523]